MSKRMGRQTVRLGFPPSIYKSYCIAGKKEGEGPLGAFFDEVNEDARFGEDTWEKAESTLVKNTIYGLLEKGGLTEEEIDYIAAGDLLNQCSGSHFAIRSFGIPFFGLYGACSTMAESMSVAAMLVDGGFASKVIAATSSHFCASEKQYRFPLEYGGQRTPTAQWTVTGSGAVVIGKSSAPPYITHITTGKIIDKGITDSNNMGAAMAPAAADTALMHFADTGFSPEEYDLVITGDLGKTGSKLFNELLKKEGLDIENRHMDCGAEIFDNSQDAHAGGSGCGCSAVTFCGKIMKDLQDKKINNVLFMATGALMNPTSSLQGESIPSIAHALRITNSGGNV